MCSREERVFIFDSSYTPGLPPSLFGFAFAGLAELVGFTAFAGFAVLVALVVFAAFVVLVVFAGFAFAAILRSLTIFTEGSAIFQSLFQKL
jgi:hypothetical protein